MRSIPILLAVMLGVMGSLAIGDELKPWPGPKKEDPPPDMASRPVEKPKPQPSPPPAPNTNTCAATCRKYAQKVDSCEKKEKLCETSQDKALKKCTQKCDDTAAAQMGVCTGDVEFIKACTDNVKKKNAECWAACDSQIFTTSECEESKKVCKEANDLGIAAAACGGCV